MAAEERNGHLSEEGRDGEPVGQAADDSGFKAGDQDPETGSGQQSRSQGGLQPHEQGCNEANSRPGPDTIGFDPAVFATPRTLTLSQGRCGSPIPPRRPSSARRRD